MKKWISLILSVVIFITSTMTFSYADEEYKEGFIECYNMNNSKKYECPVIVEDDTLYMDAEYISKISSYSIEKMEGTLDFYKDTNKSSAINRISVHLNEEIASYYSCNNKYDLENIIIKDEAVYLPLEKMLYLMHGQWTVKSGVLGVQTPIYDLYDFIESEFGNITQNMVKDGDILIAGESSIGRSIRAALSTVVDDFSPTLFIPFYGGQKFEQDQYEKVLLGLCQDDSTFLDNTSKKNVEKLLESSPIENVSKSYDSLGRFLELQDNLESSDNFKDAFKSINIFDARCIDFDMSIPVGDIIGGGITVWKAVSEANELENRSKQWTRDYMNQIKALANADLSPYGDASYMKNARSVARKFVKEKEGKYNKALEKTLNTIVEQDLSALISLTIAGSLVNVISIGTDVTKMLNPNAEEGLNRGKLSGLLKSTANISAIAYNEVEKYHNFVYWSPNKDEAKIEGLRSSLVLLLRSNLRAKEYIYYLKSDDKWDYRGEEKDLKRRIEKDYALICKLSETARYDKALEVDSDFKSIYSEENGKYRVNILESGINIFEKEDITMEQFKNSYLYICTDNCRIKDVYSCPYVGDSNNAKYTKLSNDEFEIKYDKLAFVFKCDGKKSYMIKYINKSNPEGYQVYTDEESLNEVSAQAHDWYNSYKKELVEKENKNNEENGSISKNKALKLAQSKGGTYDEELGTNILYTNEGICYHEDCFCTYKDKQSYLFTVKLENTNRVIGYICVYNDGSLVEWYNPNDNW